MKVNTYFAWLAIILGCYYWHYGQPYLARAWAYPHTHDRLIARAAGDQDVSPALIHAIILQESKYQEDAQSGRGALGLMQLMPDTAHWIGEQLDMEDLTDDHLSHPETNIRLGSWYIGYLLKEYHGNEILALAAYNAGHGHVDQWMEDKGWGYDFNDPSAIPFPETRNYVEHVLDYERKYEELYGNYP